jgi:hypothetical protein
MGTYKKKDFKKIKSEDLKVKEEKIDELVGPDGAELEDGDDIDGVGTNNSEIQAGPTLPYDDKGDPTTSRDHEKSAIQPRRDYYIDGVGGTHTGSVVGVGNMYEGEELDEIAKAKMRKMVKELLSNRNQDNEMVNRSNSSDVNRNQIPDLTELNPTISNKVNELIKAVGANQLSKDEIGIVLNHIVMSLDTSQISPDYKNLIKKNL